MNVQCFRTSLRLLFSFNCSFPHYLDSTLFPFGLFLAFFQENFVFTLIPGWGVWSNSRLILYELAAAP